MKFQGWELTSVLPENGGLANSVTVWSAITPPSARYRNVLGRTMVAPGGVHHDGSKQQRRGRGVKI